MKRPATALDWLRRGLLLVGVVCLASWGWVTTDAWLYEHVQGERLDRLIAAHQATADSTPRTAPPPRVEKAGTPPRPLVSGDGIARTEVRPAALVPDAPSPVVAATDDELIGRLELPRIGLSAVVSAHSGTRALRRGASHIAGTALPGEAGNVGIAGHRDRVFRSLRFAAPGDLVLLETPSGTRRYAIETVRVVAPGETEVLAPTAGESLTLVTCYPFSFFGAAPERYVVHAQLIDT